MIRTFSFVLLGLLLISFNSAAGFSGSYSGVSGQSLYGLQPSFDTYYSGDQIQTYWPALADRTSCENREDVLLAVAPAGCQPTVVRSDLLAEQNVPVFCQIDALKINPLLEIKDIDNIRFSGRYPSTVSGAGFHPARAALLTHDRLLGSPLINNIGYVVVVLKKQENESALPDSVVVNLSARIEYSAGNSIGVGKAEYILQEMDDATWEKNKNMQTFWGGRYFVRLEGVDAQSALVSIYQGDRKLTSVRVQQGQLSREIYMPGYYCQVGLQVAFDGYIGAQRTARIEVSSDSGTDVLDLYQGSRFLNDQCRIERINNASSTGTKSVSIVCNGNSGAVFGSNRFTLQITPRESIIRIGDSVRITQGAEQNKVGNVSAIDNSSGQRKYTVDFDSSNKAQFFGYQIALLDAQGRLVDTSYSQEAEQNFADSISALESIADGYPHERKDPASGATYGEEALQKAVELAKQYNKPVTEVRILEKLLRLYSDSSSAYLYRNRLQEIYSTDSSLGSNSVLIGNKYWGLRLLEVNEPSKFSEAEISWGRLTNNLRQGEPAKSYPGIGNLSLVRVTSPEEISVAFTCSDFGTRTSGRSGSITLKIGGSAEACGQILRLNRADVNDYAKIRLLPKVDNAQTETNLTVRIGIEKRAIKLSPQQTQDKIRSLNESIKKWESLSKGLNGVVSGLKAACLTAGIALPVKNFLTGLDGTSFARQKVMRGEGGWTDVCSDLVASGKFSTLSQCYQNKSREINQDVSTTANEIKEMNERLSGIEERFKTSSDLLDGDSIDIDKAATEYARQLNEDHGSKVVGKNGETVSQLLSYNGDAANRPYTYDQLRELELNLRTQDSGSASLQEKAKKGLEATAGQIKGNQEVLENLKQSQALQSKGFPAPNNLAGKKQNVIYSDVKPIGSNAVQIDTKATHMASFVTNGEDGIEAGKYLARLEKPTGSEQYIITSVAKIDSQGQIIEEKDRNAFVKAFNIGGIIAQSESNYVNSYLNPKVSYFENSPYKGMPHIVPFETKEGWYAATKQTLSAFGGIGAFESSGRVASFWLCNVGQNGREQFDSGLGDDICQLINLNGLQPYGAFPGLSEAKAKDLTNKAVKALQDAANQYGNKVVRINNQQFNVGAPGANIPATQCEDFMSPGDCKLLFNLCDPVICPSSRCNLGGTYPVANVAQTGIIGSTLLCLPNIREGIYIPVCLTGIQAGIDGFVSVLKSHRECLQESLDTGRVVGICDQIYSVYLCEFFWNELAPVANVLIPKLVEAAYGQGSRGGGEYLTVAGAWQNMQNSIDYFTQSYAQNSLKSFQARSIGEAGGEFCKAFVTAKAPTNFKTLIEPDSPPQFHAYFDSSKFTDATVPATSQYKVFYHIFAGNDAGVNYRVYLKSKPESSYYYVSPYVTVAAGYINRGETKSETRDFTAPEGYGELCVNINGEEKCGFKQVTTNFAVNYLTDKYVENQATSKGITSERECISGSRTASSLLVNPNIQSGASEATSPDISQRGIVRICGTQNPGSATDPTRFVDVGYCDDPKVRCYVDKKSVNDAISDDNVGLRNQTLQNLQQAQIASLSGTNLPLDRNNTIASISKAEVSVDSTIGRIAEQTTFVAGKNIATQEQSKLNTAFGERLDKVVYNDQKAAVLLLSAKLKVAVAQLAYNLLSGTVRTSAGSQAGAVDPGLTLEQGDEVTSTDLVNQDCEEYRAIIEAFRRLGEVVDCDNMREWSEGNEEFAAKYGITINKLPFENPLDRADSVLAVRQVAIVVVVSTEQGEITTIYEGADKFYSLTGSAREFEITDAMILSKS